MFAEYRAAIAESAGVSQESYTAWEKEVIDKYKDWLTQKPKTPLIPEDGQVSVLEKVKFILVVDANVKADSNTASFEVSQKMSTLPPKTKLKMWHVGKHKEDGVSYGWDEEKNVFLHPACDVGGLTNMRQTMGEDATFLGGFPWPLHGHNSDSIAVLLHAWWCNLSKKNLEDTLSVTELSKWLQSVQTAFPLGCILRFHKLSPEHRVVVKAADVIQKTGRYFVRTFKDEPYAKVSDGKELFCGITDKFVTPNLNRQNLSIEYVPYDL